LAAIVDIPTGEITDWPSFHGVFAAQLGFPEFYGRNMDAWVDCLTSADEDDGMLSVTVAPGEVLTLRLLGAADFKRRCPDIFDAVVGCAAAVNERRIERGGTAVLALSYCA